MHLTASSQEMLRKSILDMNLENTNLRLQPVSLRIHTIAKITLFQHNKAAWGWDIYFIWFIELAFISTVSENWVYILHFNYDIKFMGYNLWLGKVTPTFLYIQLSPVRPTIQ